MCPPIQSLFALVLIYLPIWSHAYSLSKLDSRAKGTPLPFDFSISDCSQSNICVLNSNATTAAAQPPDIDACEAVALKWDDGVVDIIKPNVAMGPYDLNKRTSCQAFIGNLGPLKSIQVPRHTLVTFIREASQKCFSDGEDTYNEVKCSVDYNTGTADITITGWKPSQEASNRDIGASVSAMPSDV